MPTRKLRNIFSCSQYGLVLLLASATAPGQVCSDGCSEARSALRLSPRHATLSVADLDTERRWYMTKLGFDELPARQPAGSVGKIQGAELEIPGFQIHLIQFEGSRRAQTPDPPFLTQGWVHVAFSVGNIARAEAFLRTAGVMVDEVREKSGLVSTLVVHDPEGNEIELFSR